MRLSINVPLVAFSRKGLYSIALVCLLCAVMSVIASLILSKTAEAAELKHGVTHLSQDEFVQKVQDKDVVIIDVRTAAEFARGHIEGAVNIAHTDIMKNASLLDQYKGKDLVLYCHSGVRVRRTTDFLREVAYVNDEQLFHLKGDIRAWQAKGRALKK